ncbi:MAG: tRNA lysidine(34) synthetase TilS [Clostridiales bacterium]|jgi:tRNA(Ile)-lysidine synthase|nr:tRNA lysidine(34) synthetase TilS [Clostridiales bacterium]
MLDKAIEILNKYVAAGQRLAVAVSGGADSMCLAALVLSRPHIAKNDVTVVNINHKIRGRDSDADSAFVKDYCVKNGVAFAGYTADVPALRALSGLGTEEEARNARMRIFADIKNGGAAELILTAHHMSDEAETVLMHLLRGGGLKGASGMPPLAGCLLRPLITTSKAEILDYVNANAVPFVTDGTNADNTYSRNFLRNKIIPLIESRWPGAQTSLVNFAAEAREASAFLDSLIDSGKFSERDGAVILSADALTKPALAPRYVFAALAKIGVNSDVTRQNILDVLALKDKRTGAAFACGGRFRVINEYGSLAFIPAASNPESTPDNAAEIPYARLIESGSLAFGGNVVTRLSGETAGRDGSPGQQLIVDESRIPNSATIRFRRPGDTFIPFGGGKRKLKEYLIDKKIPQVLRGKIPLICDGSEVLCVLGVELSDKLRVADGGRTAVAKSAVALSVERSGGL